MSEYAASPHYTFTPHPYSARAGYSVQQPLRQRAVDVGRAARFLNPRQLAELPHHPQWGVEPARDRYARDIDTSDPANFYGRFIALGYTHMTRNGSYKDRNTVFELWRRRDANGWVAQYNRREPPRIVTEQQRSVARTEVRNMSSVGERSQSAAFRSPAPSK